MTDHIHRNTNISLLLHPAAVYVWWIKGGTGSECFKKCDCFSLALLQSFPLERPRPNPAICWLHPGEQKLVPADDPEHPMFPHMRGRKKIDVRHPDRVIHFWDYDYKNATCMSNNKCSEIVLAGRNGSFM